MAEPQVLFGVADTGVLYSPTLNVGGRAFHTFAGVTAAFGGSLEIQGQYTSESAWHKVRYWVHDPGQLWPTGPFLDTILPPVTGVRRYYVIDPWQFLRVAKAQSGGTITLDYFPLPLDAAFLLLPQGTPAASVVVAQADAEALQVQANLTWGLEGVDELHPVPVIVEELPDVGVKGSVAVVPKIWVSKKVVIPYGATVGALEANDALGDKFYFDYSVDGEPLPAKGRILTIRRYDPSDVVLADTIHIFASDFTAAASDAAFTISAADSLKQITSQVFPAGTDLGSAKVAEIVDVNVDYYCPLGVLVCQESTTGTPTPTSAAMPTVQLFILPFS